MKAGRIGVLGAGGMGSAFAALLARSGHDVVLIGRGSEHVRAVAERGLAVLPPDGRPWTVALDVSPHAEDLPPGSLDAVVILTKAYDLQAAACSVAPALTPGGVAVSLQNGLGLAPRLAAVFGDERSLVGTTTVGAALQGPGRISVSAATAAGESFTYLGEMGEARGGSRAAGVVAALSAAGIPSAYLPQVGEEIWRKLALAVMSPVSSVLRLTVGQVWASDEGRSLVRRMFDEVVAVALAQQVRLDPDRAWAHASQVFEGTGEHYTSMCADVMNGRRTELSSMAGAVHRIGREQGVPVPTHGVVLEMLGALGVR
ncbi:ketopantoate reductase family protein [Streptosporangium amethystogenes]|uniref:ketopantoate reductase family protein n=1 Tax=Streptosporangium amethystogenes TaxID=2002 RepID=UPI0037A0FBEB